MLIGNQQLSTRPSHLQKYIHERVLHVINGLGLCLWMVMMYLFGENYLVITIAIGMHLLLEMYWDQNNCSKLLDIIWDR